MPVGRRKRVSQPRPATQGPHAKAKDKYVLFLFFPLTQPSARQLRVSAQKPRVHVATS